MLRSAFDLCVQAIPEHRVRYSIEESYGGSILKTVIHNPTIESQEREDQLKQAEQHQLNSQKNILRFNTQAGQHTSFIYNRNLQHLILLYKTWNKKQQQQKWENSLAEIVKRRTEKDD